VTPILEVIALNTDDARRARDGGADRLEVCGDMSADGTTPDVRVLEAVVRLNLSLDVMAMIRPRDGNFVYNAAELEEMWRSVVRFAEIGVTGVVLGCLTPDFRVDKVGLRELTSAAKPLSVTFHRAFDSVLDRGAALDALSRAGVDRVLTLGYPCGALRQRTVVATVADTARLAAGRLSVMTGGWLEATDVDALLRSGIREFHLGRAVRSSGGYASPIDVARVREWRTRLRHGR
jgi:copper homeostasis protein